MFIKDLLLTLKESGVMFLLFCVVLFTCTFEVNVYLLVLFCLLVFVFCQFIKHFDRTSLWLILFSISYSSIVVVSKQTNSYFDCIGYLIAPISFYCFGKYMGENNKTEEHLLILLFLVILIYPLNLYIGGIRDIIDFGIVNPNRSLYLLGRGDDASATLYGLNLTLGFVGFTTFFAIKRSLKSILAWFFLSIAILSVIINLHLLNRTGLVVALICVLIVTAFLSKNNWWRFVAIISILALVVYLLFKEGIISDEIIEGYERRNQDVEKLKTGNDRTNRWIMALKYMFMYPLGWSQNLMAYNKYVHNLWLDIARVAGIIPFTCFFVATLRSLKYPIKMFGWKPNATTATLIGLNVCFIFSSIAEPVMEGFPIHMYLFCFIWGVQKSYFNKKTQNVYEVKEAV